MIREFAKNAYDAREIASGRVNRGNKPLTPFDELSALEQATWDTVVKTILMMCAAELDRQLDP